MSDTGNTMSSTPATDSTFLLERERIIAGVSFTIGVVACVLAILLIVIIRYQRKRCLSKRNHLRDDHAVIAISASVRNETYGFISEVPSRHSELQRIKSVNSQSNSQIHISEASPNNTEPRSRISGYDSDYSLARSVRGVDDVGGGKVTIAEMFNSQTFDKKPTEIEEINVKTSDTSLKRDPTYQNVTKSKQSFEPRIQKNDDIDTYLGGIAIADAFSSQNSNSVYQNRPSINEETVETESRNNRTSTMNTNVARVKPTFLEINTDSVPIKAKNDKCLSPVMQEGNTQINRQRALPLTEDKAVQTNNADLRESILGYSKPKDTGPRREVKNDSNDEYDYASFINLIKYAVQSSLSSEEIVGVQRTMSADNVGKQRSKSAKRCKQNLFVFPDYNDKNTVTRSYSHTPQAIRPPERLPMPLAQPSAIKDYVHEDNSYFKKPQQSEGITSSDTKSNLIKSPPYIDPKDLNTKKRSSHETDSETSDSDNDLMDIDGDLADYVSTLRKKKEGNSDIYELEDDEHENVPSAPSQIKVEIRKSMKKQKGERSSYIFIELNDNFLSRLKKKAKKMESIGEGDDYVPMVGDEDYVPMDGQHDPVYGNVESDNVYMDMSNTEGEHGENYMCMD